MSSFQMWNELFLYAMCGCVGFLAGIVVDILKDERSKKNKNLLDSDSP